MCIYGVCTASFLRTQRAGEMNALALERYAPSQKRDRRKGLYATSVISYLYGRILARPKTSVKSRKQNRPELTEKRGQRTGLSRLILLVTYGSSRIFVLQLSLASAPTALRERVVWRLAACRLRLHAASLHTTLSRAAELRAVRERGAQKKSGMTHSVKAHCVRLHASRTSV